MLSHRNIFRLDSFFLYYLFDLLPFSESYTLAAEYFPGTLIVHNGQYQHVDPEQLFEFSLYLRYDCVTQMSVYVGFVDSRNKYLTA